MSFTKVSATHNPAWELTEEQRRLLLDVARRSGTLYLETHQHLNINLADCNRRLAAAGNCFVTLKNQFGELAGCIGSLEARRALIIDVAENTIAAATQDSRFSTMSIQAFDKCSIEISVLTPQEKIIATNKADLLAQLRPDQDGVIVDDGARRATFLPKVWHQLPDKEDFYRNLMQKAGLSAHFWSDRLCFYRYYTIDFNEKDFAC